MSYISPNFEIDTDPDSSIITPQLKDDGSDKGVIDEYMLVEKLGAGAVPIVLSEKINRDRVLLAKVDPTKSMWLYPSGEIKTEV